MACIVCDRICCNYTDSRLGVGSLNKCQLGTNRRGSLPIQEYPTMEIYFSLIQASREDDGVSIYSQCSSNVNVLLLLGGKKSVNEPISRR